MSNGLPMFPSPVLIDRDGNETRIQHGDLIVIDTAGDNMMRLTYRRPDPSKPRVDDRLRLMDRDGGEAVYEHVLRGHEPICPEYHQVFRQIVGALLGMLVVYKPDLSRARPSTFLVWDLAVAPYSDD